LYGAGLQNIQSVFEPATLPAATEFLVPTIQGTSFIGY